MIMIPSYTKCPLKPPPNINYPPLTIGHRGTSFYIPEHTLAGYRLALELGADYIEPDLVPTKDNILIAMHDIDLNITSNVAQIFPDRYRINVTHDDQVRSGYFSYDFTLEEIKQLRVKQRIEDTPARSRYFDWEFTIPTLDEIIDLLHDWNYNVTSYIHRDAFGKRGGLYAELKHPQWIQDDSDIQVSDLLLHTLKYNPKAQTMFFNDDCITSLVSRHQFIPPPLVIQCFEVGTLDYIRKYFIDHAEDFNKNIPPNAYLVTAARCNTASFFKTLKKYKDTIDGVGPDKSCILNNQKTYVSKIIETLGEDTVLHPWTERLEIEFVNTTFNNADDELQYLFCEEGINGIFAENVDLVLRVSLQPCNFDSVSSTNVLRSQWGVDGKLCSSSNSLEWMRFVQGILVGAFFGLGLVWFILRKRMRNEHHFHSVDVAHIDIIS